MSVEKAVAIAKVIIERFERNTPDPSQDPALTAEFEREYWPLSSPDKRRVEYQVVNIRRGSLFNYGSKPE